MEPLQLSGGKVVLYFDGAMVDTFQWDYTRGFRTPAAWIGVKVEPRKHDRVRFTVGRVEPGTPIYGQDLSLDILEVPFELDAAEEPSVRGFFAEVARVARRAGPT